MPTISKNDIAKAIYLSTKDKDKKSLEEANQNVVRFLDKKRLLGKSESILEELEKVINKDEGILVAKLKSKNEVSKSTKDFIKDHLKKRYRAKEIEFREEKVDDLIGGVRIEVEDEVIDLSIKNKIKKLQAHIK